MEALNTQFQIAIKLLTEATQDVKADWERRMNTCEKVLKRLNAEQEAIANKWYAENEEEYKAQCCDTWECYRSRMGEDIYEKCPTVADYEALIQEWGDMREHLLMYQDIFDPDCEDGCVSEMHEKFELHPENFSNLDAAVVALVANGGFPTFGPYPDQYIDLYQSRIKRNRAITAAQTMTI